MISKNRLPMPYVDRRRWPACFNIHTSFGFRFSL